MNTRFRTIRAAGFAVSLTAAGFAVSLTAAGFACLATAAPSHAQVHVSIDSPGPGPGGGAISKASFNKYGEILMLDEAQKQAAQSLFDIYRDASAESSRKLSERLKGMQNKIADGEGGQALGGFHEVITKHGEESGKLTTDFLTDLKSLLTQQQTEQLWPRLDRFRRRASWLKFGPVSGSAVDLITLVDRMKLPAEQTAKLTGALDQYEIDIDRVLVEREIAEQNQAAAKKNSKKAGGDGMMAVFDPEEFAKIEKRDRENAMKVRDVNQRYARLLGSLLPDDLRTKLDEQFKVASFKSIYKTSHTQKSLTAAAKLDDLTPEQRERVRQIEESYTRELKAANERWATAQAAAEAEGKAHSFPVLVMDEGANQHAPKDLDEARKARRELDKRAREQLAQVLTDEQQERLPKPGDGRKLAGGPRGQRMAVMAHDDGEGGGGVFVMAQGVEDDGVDLEEIDEEEEDGAVFVRKVIVEHRETEPPHTEPANPETPPQNAPPK